MLRRVLERSQDGRGLAALGVGNDEFICTHVTPGLSSIIPDFEGNGYRATRELQTMMLRDRIPPKHEYLCPIKGVEERGSTSGPLSSAALVQRALAYIGENALKGISARDWRKQKSIKPR